ncbi:hypothetical protein BaRGS_00023073 [Batillaria attramentaria]|uniref:HAT C-terminal dimerisation domain-containing protein n=1 Tax=Batillaria attramentaria TaxID=370345 RepID=A0ABD0KET9_9CAEN
MTGRHNGVGVRLQHQQLALVHVHCAAHRVALATKDVTEVVTELEEEAQSQRGNAGAATKVSHVCFHRAMTYMLSDIIPVMEKLNLTFQRDSVNLSDIEPAVKCASDTLLAQPGENEENFTATVDIATGAFQGVTLTRVERRATFQHVRADFIQALIQSLEKHFPDEQLSVLKALANVFDRDRYPSPKQRHPLDAHATADLALHTRRCATVINGPWAQRDFNQFKRALVRYGGPATFESSCRIAIRNLAVSYPDFALLAKIALVIPVSSVPAERGFSEQNKIRTSAHNQLSEDRVSKLRIHARDIGSFDITAASDWFHRMRARRK